MYDAPADGDNGRLPEHPPKTAPAFTDLFVKRPVLALVVSLLILLVGLRCMITLPVRQFPMLTNTMITISTSYPGATASLMQGFITQPIEQAVASAEGIDYLTSSSTQGSSTINVYIKLNYDSNKSLTEVMSKVQQVKYLIPKESNDPIITKQTGDQFALLYIGFASTTMSNSAVADYVSRAVQPRIATVPGVASADLAGAQTFAMRLWLDPARMAARAVTADDVDAAILANNFQAAPGQAKGYYTVTDVSANTGLNSVEQFRDMVVKSNGDQLVRMRDIANVRLDAQSYTSDVAMNGISAVFLPVTVTPDGNPLNVARDVRAMMPDIVRNLPPGMIGTLQFDGTDFINASIREVVRTLGEAIVIVILVIFVFLGSFRAVIIPVVTIPLSLIGAGIIMAAFGFSLNLLTMLAMVLAIGLVVDDAIVVVENVYRWIEMGKTPIQAALIGAREIAGPVIAMTITLAAVYAPIGFLGGLTGTLFREFAFALAGAVLISGVIALTLSPMMCSVLLTRGSLDGGFSQLINRMLSRITGFYGRLLTRSLAFRPLIVLFALAVLFSAIFMFFNSKAELAPEEDEGVLFAVLKAPTYANIDYMRHVIKRVHEVYTEVPERETDFMNAGIQNAHDGFGGILLKPWETRRRTALQIQPELQGLLTAQIPESQTFLISPPSLPGSFGGLPVGLVINSTADYRTLYEVMEELKQAARQSHLFIVVDSDLAFDSPIIRIKIDHSKANSLGISMQAIGNTLAVMMGGNYINRFTVGGRGYEVIPQVPRAQRFDTNSLERYYVRARNGQVIPLSAIARLEQGTEPNALVRFNQLNSAQLSAIPMPGVSMGQAVAFLEEQVKNTLPHGFSHDYVSESRQFVHEGTELTITFLFALIFIFLVLAAQFESIRDPLVVLVTVPLSISGALLPMFFGVVTLNIYTQVGLVTLIGLISKHGILMVEFARELQLNQGLSKVEAIQQAAQVRLRPILMTTAAMIVGLIPLLLASGAGAASRFSIGIVIVFGMTIGTLFTLFVLPTVYTLIARDHRADRASPRVQEIAAVG